jgi:hypothetical protein
LGSGTRLEEDIERLKRIKDGMWQFQVERLEDKQEEAEGYGVPLPSYREVIGRAVMENMGRNVVQFTEALVMMDEKDVVKQGADMLNLVLMLIDKGTPNRAW